MVKLPELNISSSIIIYHSLSSVHITELAIASQLIYKKHVAMWHVLKVYDNTCFIMILYLQVRHKGMLCNEIDILNEKKYLGNNPWSW